ncbi:MAG: 2-isopropylmalate synthase [Parcubacteria group bacterium GW2011_GWF2_43_11]|nr:MAG: 2-isopropylmalate synthase [Parcubacteria group bacterium GW2011_GWF2_43_11]
MIIFDTTLRDGEQAAGGTLTAQEKLQIAQQLEKLKVDVIEAGFPISSQGEFEAVSLIAQKVRTPIICALSHANPEAVTRAYEAIKKAERPRIHIFLSTSEIHRIFQLNMTPQAILELAEKMVRQAKALCEDIEFSPMDATRTDPNYIYKILKTVISAGATTVNIPDTVGYTIPDEYGELIEGIFQNVPNINKAVISVHCHNDLGLAVANSLKAVKCGARQVECTINGIGERAGNASLEEIVMAIKTRQDLFPNLSTSVETTQIYKTSKLVSELTGFSVQANKAIVGSNAFSHESGIHQDGILKKQETYEIIDPKTVGVPTTNLSVGKLSGRHALKERLLEIGYELNDEEFERFYKTFKEMADKKKKMTDKDIESLIAEEQRQKTGTYKLDRIQVSCGDKGMATAAIRITTKEKNTLEDAAIGTGPVDAVYRAINRLVNLPNNLTEFAVKSVTEGIDAIGEVLIRIESNDVLYTGRGMDTDIIVASAKAYINALNRLLATKK